MGLRTEPTPGPLLARPRCAGYGAKALAAGVASFAVACVATHTLMAADQTLVPLSELRVAMPGSCAPAGRLPSRLVAACAPDQVALFRDAQTALDREERAFRKTAKPDLTAVAAAVQKLEPLLAAASPLDAYAVIESARALILAETAQKALDLLEQHKTRIAAAEAIAQAAGESAASPAAAALFFHGRARKALAKTASDAGRAQDAMALLAQAIADFEAVRARTPASVYGERALVEVFKCDLLTQKIEALGPLLAVEHREFITGLLSPPARAAKLKEVVEGGEAQNDSEPRAVRRRRPPADGAPIDALLAFWLPDEGPPEGIKPTPRVAQRLIAMSKERPEYIAYLLPLLGEDVGLQRIAKAVLEKAEADGSLPSEARERIRRWLILNCNEFHSELVATAGDLSVSIYDWGTWVNNRDAMDALAKRDWPAAERLLRQHATATDPNLATFAQVQLYQHAVDTGDENAAPEFRATLRRTVEDRQAADFARATACAALLSTVWPGRDEWYMALFSDPTFARVLLRDRTSNSLWTPLAIPAENDPARWVPVLAKLVSGDDRVTRGNAANCLVRLLNNRFRDRQQPEREIILPLLPWLNDPDWVDLPRERNTLLYALKGGDVREAIPGLLHMVRQGLAARRDGAPAPDGDAQVYASFEFTPAVEALSRYSDPEAITVAKEGLRVLSSETRWGSEILSRLVAMNAFTPDEIMAAIVAYAQALTDTVGKKADPEWNIARCHFSYGVAQMSYEAKLGRWFCREPGVCVSLTERILEHARRIRAQNPATADTLEFLVATWPGPQSGRLLLQQVAAAKADLAQLRELLEGGCQALRQHDAADLRQALQGQGLLRGFVAAALGDAGEARTILTGKDSDATVMLLACARLARMPLPVRDVARLLGHSDELLRRVAWQYLASEDSRDSRAVLHACISKGPEILGATSPWHAGDFGPSETDGQERLLERLSTPPAPDEILAFLIQPPGGCAQWLVEVRKDKADLLLFDADDWYRRRPLSQVELRDLLTLVRTQHVDDLPPLETNVCDGLECSYVHLTPDGGRRVYMNNPEVDGASVYGQLNCLFDRLAGTGEFQIVYPALERIPGARLLLPAGMQRVLGVWRNGEDSRVLLGCGYFTGDEWRRLRDGHTAEKTDWPPGVHNARPDDMRDGMWGWDCFSIHINNAEEFSTWQGWRILAGRPDSKSERGLWRWREGEKPVLLSKGTYAGLIVAESGPWAIAVKKDEGSHAPVVAESGPWVIAVKKGEGSRTPDRPVRVNLETGAETALDVAVADTVATLTWFHGTGRVLLCRRQDKGIEQPENPEYLLVEPASATVERLQGDTRPLDQAREAQSAVRRLFQATGEAGVVWCAVVEDLGERGRGTSVGRYDLRAARFAPVATYPGLTFNSFDMWVAPDANAVYVAHQGNLLQMPLNTPRTAP